MSVYKKIRKALAQWEQNKNNVMNQTNPVPAVTAEPPGRTTQLEAFLNGRYDFRYNVLSGQTEFRPKGTDVSGFRPLDKREQNRLCMELCQNGLKGSLSGLLRYTGSSLIEEFHPFRQYLDELPEWDGKERVDALARRVSQLPLWVNGFHRWMRALAAQWMGMDKLHANSMAPLLVSEEQGMMKSTFCKSLMPDSLQDYYTDRIDLSSKGNMEEKLAVMGLVNMDEYDRLSEPQMALLKNLMQTPALTIRKAYRHNYIQLPRIASFIGTSNRRDLLTDDSGSRRFLCVTVSRPIDCTGIELDQVMPN